MTDPTDEAATGGMNEVLRLIEENFTVHPVTTDGKKTLRCNHCGWAVTWATKHLAVRHPYIFPALTVVEIPAHMHNLELW